MVMDVIGKVIRPVVQSQHPGCSQHVFGVVARKLYLSQWIIFPMVVEMILEYLLVVVRQHLIGSQVLTRCPPL